MLGWESGEGVKARGFVKRHWPLWLEYPKGECQAATAPKVSCADWPVTEPEGM